MAERYISNDWRSRCDSFLKQWSHARKNNFYTDVDFVVGEGISAKSFSAHKIVLALCSPAFEAMFYGPIAEKKSPIAIVDCEPDAFELLLRFAYGEEITFSSMKSAEETHALADMYLVSHLKTEAEKYMSEFKIKDNCQFWEMLQDETNLLDPIMKNACLDYLSENANTLLKSDLMLDIPENIMNDFLKMELINATEYELLLAIARWSKGPRLDHPILNFNRNVTFLLSYIRFRNISSEEFSDFHENHPCLISKDDSLAILKYLCNPSKFKLPDWCSTVTTERIIQRWGKVNMNTGYKLIEVSKDDGISNSGYTLDSRTAIKSMLETLPLVHQLVHDTETDWWHAPVDDRD